MLIPLLCLSLILLAALYVYLLSKSVLNVVIREEIEAEIAIANSAMGEIEAQYLELKDSIDRVQIESFGLQALSSKTYVARHSLSERGLTLNQ